MPAREAMLGRIRQENREAMEWLIALGLVGLLIAAHAVCVAAEFSTVASRKTRLATLAGQGDRLAGWVLEIAANPRALDRFVAAAQVGITLSTLVLGFYGQQHLSIRIEPLLEQAGLSPAAAPGLAATSILLFLTGLEVILGELFPKNLGLQYPETTARLMVAPMRWSSALLHPLIELFNGSGRAFLKLFGASQAGHAHLHTAGEIRMMVGESKSGGLLDDVEYQLLDNTLRIREYTAHQVMVPRKRLLLASADSPSDQLLTLLADSPYSRLPLYEGSSDNIVGVVHLKDLLCQVSQSQDRSARSIMRPMPAFPQTITVKRLFTQLQREHFHVAVVLDEYGGTAGIATLEDLIERIFGSFEDEFDPPRPPMLEHRGDRLHVRGDVLLADLEDWLDRSLKPADADTLGGLILERMGRLPEHQEELTIEGLTVRIEQVDDYAITEASVTVDPSTLELLRSRGLLP
ncbi:MAG: HlyC/CorC family transporter [Armatimonadetes bacterium]|nr:HlyC/CorC family transporter [Armatimonadota bacterium]